MRPPRTKLTQCRWRVALFGIFCLALVARAEKIKDLQPQGYVNDFAGVLNAQTQAQITELCKEVDEKTQAQIAVVTIKTLEGLEAADFANQLFKKWGIGHKDDNRGVLILLAANDHKYWTEVGYGLEPILPDGKVGGFGREMVPNLRAGDYNGAVLHLLLQIADVIATDRGVKLNSQPAAKSITVTQPENENDASQIAIGLLMLAGLIALLVLATTDYLAPAYLKGTPRFWRWAQFILVMLGSRQGGGRFGGGGFGGSGGGSFGGFGGGLSGGGGAGGSW